MPHPTFEDIEQAKAQLSSVQNEHWIHDEFLSGQWWLLLGMTIIPYFIWWRVVDKRRTQEILLYGMLIALFGVILNHIGADKYLLWGYPDKLWDVVPPLFPHDYVMIPVILMITYQFFSAPYGRFLAANAATGAFMAFIGQPIFIQIGVYKAEAWTLWISFSFYLLGTSLARMIVRATRSRETTGTDPADSWPNLHLKFGKEKEPAK